MGLIDKDIVAEGYEVVPDAMLNISQSNKKGFDYLL